MIRARLTVPLALVLSGTLAGPALAAPPAAQEAPGSTTYALVGDGAFPEGVGVFGQQYYVGATSDGTVYRGTVGSDAVAFLPGGEDGRTTAIGIKATRDRLYVAGGDTGLVFVYDRLTGDLLARYTNGGPDAGPTFLNDLAVAPDGSAYVTDSQRPVLYRIPAEVPADGGTYPLPVTVDFRGTAFAYVQGFNANGIAISPDGRTAYVVQSATGELFGVRLKDRGTQNVFQVDVVDPDGATYALTNGDGILLQGSTLSVLQNSDEVLDHGAARPQRTPGRRHAAHHRRHVHVPDDAGRGRRPVPGREQPVRPADADRDPGHALHGQQHPGAVAAAPVGRLPCRTDRPAWEPLTRARPSRPRATSTAAAPSRRWPGSVSRAAGWSGWSSACSPPPSSRAGTRRPTSRVRCGPSPTSRSARSCSSSSSSASSATRCGRPSTPPSAGWRRASGPSPAARRCSTPGSRSASSASWSPDSGRAGTRRRR